MPVHPVAFPSALLLLAIATAAAAEPTRSVRAPEIRLHRSAADALREMLREEPRVVAFGEYHQTAGGPRVASSLSRFTRELLEVLRPHLTDLVIETWVTEGKCGEEEKTVVAEIERTTERPQATETEIETLVKAARAASVAPHILELSCQDYRSLSGEGGSLDFERMLLLTTHQLDGRIRQVISRRGADATGLVAVYGGALHNDLHPQQMMEPYSFAEAIKAAVGGRYLEVDLYVPELIERDRRIRAEPWYPRYRRQSRAGRVTVVRRGPGSYIIVFARTAPAPVGPSRPVPPAKG